MENVVAIALQEASSEPYFFEALVEFARERPREEDYEQWRAARSAAMDAGRE